MISTKVHGDVKDGKLIADRPDFLKQAFASREGKRCTVTVGDYKTTRSLRQNAYMYGVVFKMIQDESEASMDEVHDRMCQLHLPPSVTENDKLGSYLSQGRTSTLSPKDMEVFLERVRVWALEWLGLRIPTPNECDYE